MQKEIFKMGLKKKCMVFGMVAAMALMMCSHTVYAAANRLQAKLTSTTKSIQVDGQFDVQLDLDAQDETVENIIAWMGEVSYPESVSLVKAESLNADYVQWNDTSKLSVLYFNTDAYNSEEDGKLEDGKLLKLTFKLVSEPKEGDRITVLSIEAADKTSGGEVVIPSGEIANTSIDIYTLYKSGGTPGQPGPGDPSNPQEPGGGTGGQPGGATGQNPKTGVSSMIALFAICAAGAGGCIFLAVKKKKRHVNHLLGVTAIGLSAVMLLQGSFVPVNAGAPNNSLDLYTYGDANLDAVVDASDLQLVIDYLLEKEDLEGIALDAANADLSQDGQISLTDLVIIQKRISNVIYKVDTPGGVDEQEGRVFYEIFVRAFYDSDGDGIGDLQGVKEKIPYLAELGIGGIWMMPITDSNSAHGYDTKNYFDINPQYGTIDDLKELVEEAHKYDILVTMDLVVNHCGSSISWYQDALANGEDSDYWDWFTFITEEEFQNLPEEKKLGANADSREEAGNPWRSVTVKGERGKYRVLGIFSSGMPDLNFDNEEVRAEMVRAGEFWLGEVGMDGFRLDAARHIFGDFFDTIYTEPIVEKNIAWWKEFRSAMEKVNPNVYLIGEVWEENTENVLPFLSEGAMNSVFNFNLSYRLLESASDEKSAVYQENDFIDNLVQLYQDYGKASNYNFIDSPFLTNHDQNRVASVLDNDDHNKTAASMLITMPGTPFIYYGEEIGMLGMKPDSDIRLPMAWYESGEGPGQSTYRINNNYDNKGERSVEYQIDKSDSMFGHYQEVINWRNNISALSNGGIDSNSLANDGLVSYVRMTENSRVLVVTNLTGEPITISLAENVYYGQYRRIMQKLVSDDDSQLVDGKLTISPYSTLIIE